MTDTILPGFPDFSSDFPNVSKNFPGYLFVKFSQTIFDQNHRICLSFKTFQKRDERTSIPEVFPCPSPRFSDMSVSEVMTLSESDVLKNLVLEVQPPLKVSWLSKRFRKTMPSALLSLYMILS